MRIIPCMVSIKTCAEADCLEPIRAQGRCRKHYNKWLTVRENGKPCSEEGCEKVAFIKGLCQPHYSRRQYESRKEKVCSIEGCEQALWAKGLCRNHWDDDRNRPGYKKVIRQITPLPDDMGMAIELEQIKDVLTSGDVAKICNVAARTVTKWIDNGTLEGYRIPGSKDRRVSKVSLLHFLRKNNMPMHVTAKRSAILYGFPQDSADIIKKLTEEDLGINVYIANDTFSAGLLMSEKKPTAFFVECSDMDEVLPMLKALELSTAEVVVICDDAERVDGMNVSVLPTPYRIKDVIDAIAKYI